MDCFQISFKLKQFIKAEWIISAAAETHEDAYEPENNKNQNKSVFSYLIFH